MRFTPLLGWAGRVSARGLRAGQGRRQGGEHDFPVDDSGFKIAPSPPALGNWTLGLLLLLDVGRKSSGTELIKLLHADNTNLHPS